MYEEERKIAILKKLQISKSATVSNMAKKFDVSESTIRRDLTSLEKSGLIKRTQGGAILQDGDSHEYNYNAKKFKHISLKQTIAETAASMVKDNTTIFLGTSTITNLMAQLLTAKDLTIATNSLDVINILNQHLKYNLIILGGHYIPMARSIEGVSAQNQILQMHFHQAFLGANGIDLQFGISTVSDIEANGKTLVINSSSETYFLCENTKFDVISKYKIANLNEITGIITDNKINPEVFEKYSRHCNLISASKQ